MYFKITNEEENHHGLQYQDGLVEDILPFNSNKLDSCCRGGIYFSNEENILIFVDYGVWIRQVEIPEDAQWIPDPEGRKWRASKLLFHPRRELFNVETLQSLIDNGVEILNHYETFYLAAAKHLKTDVLKYLMSINNNEEEVKRVNRRALYKVASIKDSSATSFLIEHLSKEDIDESNALEEASREGCLENVKLLVQSGVEVSKSNYSSFRYAAEYGNPDVVKFFLDNTGIDLSTCNTYALAWSAYHGALDVVKILMTYNADLSSQNYRAIRYAIERNRLDVIKLFIEEYSAPMEFYSPSQKKYITFLDFATEKKAYDIINYFRDLKS